MKISSSNHKSQLFFLLALLTIRVGAQDVNLDEISKQDPIKVSGSVSVLNRFYVAHGIENRQENYIWTLSGNLNFSIFGIAVPLSGSLTSQNSDFTQPYNRLSLKPTYKWAKAHIGYSNMTYSTYTLAGHTFLGGGLELTPNKIRFAANYGRFATAIPLDRATNQPFVPSFDRFGYGGKIGYGDESNYIDLLFFNAKDQQDSWEVIPDSSAITPGENVVLGTAWKISKIKNLTFSGEFARSAYTVDVRDELIAQNSLFAKVGLDTRASTTFRNAYKSSISYRLAGHTISGNYERIDPDYQTMGAYFFNNDMENVTAAYSSSFFKKRLSLAVNGGLQRNNLEGTEESESRRTIAAGNLIFAKNPYTVGLNFSNYAAEVRFVLNPALDSLNAVVVTQSAALFGSYILSSGSVKHVFSFNLNNQKVVDDFESVDRSSDNKVFTGTLTYTAKLADNRTDINARINYNKNDLGGIVTTRIGPGASVKRKFLDGKVNTTTSVNYFTSEGNKTLTALLNGSMTMKSKHALALNISYIRRTLVSIVEADTASSERFGEMISTINYSYSF